MIIFPITKDSFEENDEYVSEIIGYKAMSPDGKTLLATGESIEEATEKALIAIYLDDSNSAPKKIKLGRIILNPKMLTKQAV